MNAPVSQGVLEQIFIEARTHHHWLNKLVPDEILHQLYELAKWGPTSANSLPMRIVFIKSAAQKEKLLPALLGSNIEQVKAAPVTAIIAYDKKFYDQLPSLFPHADIRPMFANNEAIAERSALQNSSLQGAYFILAARALGLDAGPMGGFNSAKVDELFLAETSWKSNFLCNLGYGDSSKLFPRGPRLDFDFACKVI
jgi:3-hydroxypropanoate dehydrogenase